jgi:hypothetical protein
MNAVIKYTSPEVGTPAEAEVMWELSITDMAEAKAGKTHPLNLTLATLGTVGVLSTIMKLEVVPPKQH